MPHAPASPRSRQAVPEPGLLRNRGGTCDDTQLSSDLSSKRVSTRRRKHTWGHASGMGQHWMSLTCCMSGTSTSGSGAVGGHRRGHRRHYGYTGSQRDPGRLAHRVGHSWIYPSHNPLHSRLEEAAPAKIGAASRLPLERLFTRIGLSREASRSC